MTSTPSPRPTPSPRLTPSPRPTPSQTVGPFYGYALPFPGGGDVAPVGHPDALIVHGYVYDGAGQPIPDALLEFWQPAPDGSRTGAPGSLRRDQVTGGYLGRNGVDFTGFARVGTDPDGHYAIRTLPPGGVPYLSVIVFARGLLHHLHTRAYLAPSENPPTAETTVAPPASPSPPEPPKGVHQNPMDSVGSEGLGDLKDSGGFKDSGDFMDSGGDALLDSLEPARRATLLATLERPGVHRFDIRLQYDGEHEETVFLDFT